MKSTITKTPHAFAFVSELHPQERYKFFILMLLFSATIAVYSIVRSLKTSIFLSMIGVEYQPLTKIFMLGLIVPVMYLYSKVVDRYSVTGVAYFWFCSYGITCLILAGFIIHPVYGLANTTPSPYRYIGWIIYFVFELYASLIISTVWSFINSLSTPHSAEKGYGLINAGGRVAGFLTAGLGGAIFAYSHIPEQYIAAGMLSLAGLLLLSMSAIVYWGMHSIPEEYMEGYCDSHEKKVKKKNRVGFMTGLRTIILQPYVFGIFWTVFAIEMINGIFDYQMNVMIAEFFHNNARGMSIFMFAYTACFQMTALLISLGGIRQLLHHFKLQRCLLITPMVVLFLAVLISIKNIIVVFVVLVILRALVYGFNAPVLEMLYIPTTKAVQFKSKSWITSFGRSFSKVSSASINLMSQTGYSIMHMGGIVSFIIALSWIFVATALGKTYQETIDHDKLIGEE
jgi:AAA family ATP:ADP antiporter